MTSIVGIVRKVYLDHQWLPFRRKLQSLIRAARARRNDFEVRFRRIRSTKPLACHPDAATQMHVLTCHKHVSMFLTSAKSLLRFNPDLAVVLHDDGSLTPGDVRTIERHIQGIRIISRKDADAIADRVLVNCPRTRAYRAQVVNSLELTDHILLGDSQNSSSQTLTRFSSAGRTRFSSGLTALPVTSFASTRRSRTSRRSILPKWDLVSHRT